jgi:hypothetical protein
MFSMFAKEHKLNIYSVLTIENKSFPYNFNLTLNQAPKK